MLALVYEQPGPVVVMETQQGCTKDIGSSRIGFYDQIAAKYGLGLVAGDMWWMFQAGVTPSTQSLVRKLLQHCGRWAGCGRVTV